MPRKAVCSQVAEVPITTEASAAIEQWPIKRFAPYERNPRKNDHAVDRMAASIREYGFKIPMLARSDGTIVDGHLRLKAALKLGLAVLPVMLCDEWTAAQVKGFRLMVNKSVGWAEWDEELLALELADLALTDLDLSLITGFSLDEIAGLTSGVPDIEFKEYDESAANDVKMIECPSCGHKFPQ